jgi:hypothetical protein
MLEIEITKLLYGGGQQLHFPEDFACFSEKEMYIVGQKQRKLSQIT